MRYTVGVKQGQGCAILWEDIVERERIALYKELAYLGLIRPIFWSPPRRVAEPGFHLEPRHIAPF